MNTQGAGVQSPELFKCPLQTAVKTRELGANTLEELHRQGQKLDLVEGDLNEVLCGRQVQASPGLVGFRPLLAGDLKSLGSDFLPTKAS